MVQAPNYGILRVILWGAGRALVQAAASQRTNRNIQACELGDDLP